jgi:hypothetical protein
MVDAAKESIDTYTRDIPGTEKKDKNGKSIPGTGGSLGCAAGVSIMYLRAFGKNIDGKVSLILGTASFYSQLRNNPDWKQRSNWKDAQPGDIIDTVTVGNVNGHIGVVIDEKINDGKSYDIISNSSSGYTGKVNDKSKAGSIQRNYSVNKWSEIANRKGVGQTYAYYFVGKY